MKRKAIGTAAFIIPAIFLVTGCGLSRGESNLSKVKLDPSNPVSLTIWHYYTGTQMAAFNELIEEFNTTVGREKGIYIEDYSQGSVDDLEAAVTRALDGVVGAGELPDMFSSYADTAYSVQQKDKLVDLTEYFSQDELDAYVDSYIQEGYFNNDDALYLFPIAKATEIMMMNKTDWDAFAQATGSSLEELATTEGVAQVAERYYEWTDSLTPQIEEDGKAFYGRDSMANYFIAGMKQMGVELFEVEQGKVNLNLDQDLIRRLWENYYIPYINGYYGGYGRFRSDDVKTGDVLAYTGSSSSAIYFPDNIESDANNYSIDYVVLPAPVMGNGEAYQIQQGAGMAVTRSNEQREYAACEFLKWFTQKEHNLKFVCESAYLPVRKEANTKAALDAVIKADAIEMNAKAYDCLVNILENFDDTTYYTTKNFDNGYNTRRILESSLLDVAMENKSAIDKAVASGMERSEAIALYSTDQVFEEWYKSFAEALKSAAFG